MELKTNYQYTYFIYPFVVKQSKYKRYLQKLIRDKNCNLKTFEMEKDIRLYKYFSPKIREFMFSSFSLSKEKIKKLKDLPEETQAGIISEFPCSIFNYDFDKDIQGKSQDENSIFFNIQKIEIICFNTGICFLAIKTNIEDLNNFSEILNFNYKFRDINQDGNKLNAYENIKIQMSNFSSIEKFTDFIKNITGSSIEAIKLNIDTERFLTYSYVCIDGMYWNQARGFEDLQSSYIKYINVLSADDNHNLNKGDSTSISKWKYTRLGISKTATMLFASSIEMNNYTILPDEYENQYFYTYIISLYKSIYLKKLNKEFETTSNVKRTRRKFIYFTKRLWIQDITEDEIGNSLVQKFNEAFELEEIYKKTKKKYEVIYKELNIEKNARATRIITITLIISLGLNILNFILLMGRK